MYSPNVNDLIAPYVNRPRSIQKAIVLAYTRPEFSGLTRRTRGVIASLVGRCNQYDGTAPIRARLDRVAEQAEVSTKTVQRTVASLREMGWIEQVSEGRSDMGCFTFRQYRFSPAFCALVELPGSARNEAETKMSDGPNKEELNLKDQPGQIFEKKPKATATTITLPPELQAIKEVGIKDTGVAKLRGLAYRAGHQLADIWKVAQAALTKAGATGYRAYRYLERMILTSSDYAGRANQIKRVATDTVEVASVIARRAKYAHKRFACGPGTIVKIYDGIAEVIRDGEWSYNIAGRDMNAVYDDIERGRLTQITA